MIPKRFILSLALAGLIAAPLTASAAGLGKLSVQSTLGQPLSAEIELFAERSELDSLTATLASQQAFQAARIPYAPVLSGIKFAVETRPSGRSVLKFSTSKPVNEPFLDLLIELRWTGGRLTRDLTLLLDPPTYVVPTPAALRSTRPAPPAVAPATPASLETTTSRVTAARAAAPPPDEVRVRHGETLAGIARQLQPEQATLEQTLVGLYEANPHAFAGNINVLLAGTTLRVPDAQTLAGTAQSRAHQVIRAQTDDWRGRQRAIADGVDRKPPAPRAAATASPQARGTLSPAAPAGAAPAPALRDRLTLGKPVSGNGARDSVENRLSAQEADAVAREKALAESSERIALLEQQLRDMQALLARQNANGARDGAGPLAVPDALLAEAAGDTLLTKAVYWGGALALIALAGLLWWTIAAGRRRQAVVTMATDDSMKERDDTGLKASTDPATSGVVNTGVASFLADSGRAGPGAIDTRDGDPIAEAEVYIAYGRDTQAEELLREAIEKFPARPDFRLKLLEIHAARKDSASFEVVAGALLAGLGHPPGPIWDKACEMGRLIDPANPLYRSPTPPAVVMPPTPAAAAPAAPASTAASAALAGGIVARAAGALASVATAQRKAVETPTTAAEHGLAFDVPLAFEPQTTTAGAPIAGLDVAPAAEARFKGLDLGGLNLPGLDPSGLDLPGLDLARPPEALPEFETRMPDDNGPDSKFDFNGLDLDLGEDSGDAGVDEVSTKIELARAYLEMGDKDGAREILGEVLSEGSDAQKADAQRLIDTL